MSYRLVAALPPNTALLNAPCRANTVERDFLSAGDDTPLVCVRREVVRRVEAGDKALRRRALLLPFECKGGVVAIGCATSSLRSVAATHL